MRLFWKYLCYIKQIVPIITNLTSSLESSNNLHEENYNGDSDETISSDDSENIKDISTDQINYNNITEVLETVKKNIYMSLKHYWKIPNKFGIMASLLNPRYKNLSFISDDNVKQKIQSTL